MRIALQAAFLMKLAPFTRSLSLALIAIPALLTAAEKPNIVVILADDLGLGDIGFYTRTQLEKEPAIETPVLDELAAQSLWFTDGHSSTALCSPTRYSMMSGNNTYRSSAPWGVWDSFRKSAFVRGEVTLGSIPKDAGYSTGFIGKWHLGGDFRDLKTGGIFRQPDEGDNTGKVDVTKFLDYGPAFCGFDYDFTLPCGIQGPLYTAYENGDWFPLSPESEIVYLNKKNAIFPKDLTSKGPGLGDSAWDSRDMGKILSQKAADFIADSPAEKPLFLYYCSPMVHLPHCPPDEFDGKKVAGVTGSHHADMVIDFDQQINRIVKALKAKGIYDNTLIVVTSDNGGLGQTKDDRKIGHRSSGNLAGHKNSPLEGGHRVPFFAVWPGKITPTLSDEPVVNQDMLATVAAIVGEDLPKGQALDSANLLPLFEGNTDAFASREFLLLPAGSTKEMSFRKGPWKLIIKTNPKLSEFKPTALYNLEENPTEKKEKNHIAAPEHEKRVKDLFTAFTTAIEERAPTVSTRK